MRKIQLILFLTLTQLNVFSLGLNHKTINVTINKVKPDNSYIELSQKFLYSIKTNEEYKSYIEAFCKLRWYILADELISDTELKTFWLNLYNAYIQLLLKDHPDAFENKKNFFNKRQLCIAGMYFSFNNIQNGVLRRSKTAWGRGYISKLIVTKKEKLLRVKSFDVRIHFALNCGAMGCPPIRFYEKEILDEQLETAVKHYLHEQVKYDEKNNEVSIPKIFKWYKGDFGGNKGIIDFLKKYVMIPQNTDPEIKFIDYQWKLDLGKFIIQ